MGIKNELQVSEENHLDHQSASQETPLRADAFDISDADKINSITQDVEHIMNTLGLDLTDDSLKGTPKRVAKMFVNEIFGGLHPDRKPKASTFENKYKYNEMLVEKNIYPVLYLRASFTSYCWKSTHCIHIKRNGCWTQ